MAGDTRNRRLNAVPGGILPGAASTTACGHPASRGPPGEFQSSLCYVRSRHVAQAERFLQNGNHLEDILATLNIKHFPEDLYAELREMAQREQRSTTQQAVYLLSRAVNRSLPYSLLELRGLGKECWRDVEPHEHVKREREAWR